MKLKFHRHAHDRAFRTPADFARFADDQKEKFGELQQSNAKAYEWWGKAVAQNWARAAATARGAEATATQVQQILASHPVFTFDSRLTRTLTQMTLAGKKAASQEIIPFLTGQRDNTSAANVHVVVLDARAEFLTALALETSSRREQGHVTFVDLLNEHEDRLKSMLDGDQQEIEDRRTEIRDLIDNSDARFQNLGQQFADNVSKWKAQWEQTHNDFVEQLATETAVKLWSNRSVAHETRYKSFRKWTIRFGLVGLVTTIVWIFAGFAFARWVFPDDATAQLAAYTAGSIALFTLFVWGLRVLIRSMMSEDHLSTDASARSALAHTYLSLTKNEAATPEDRAIILATLFAPVSDGLVKDDGMPMFSPAAMAAHVLTNPGR